MSSGIPTHITYSPEEDVARVWLKGGAGPGEVILTEWAGPVSLGYDGAGRLILIQMPGESLHPDLVPFTQREYPAEGNL